MSQDEAIDGLEAIMGEAYVPSQFWRDAGEAYWRPGIEPSPEHVAQEELLRDLFASLEWSTVLDVGCGGARLGRLLHELRPESSYTGLDLSPRALEVAQGYLPEAELIQGSVVTWEPPAGSRWDLVLSSEVLMHVEPEHVAAAVWKLQQVARQLVAVEWVIRDQPPPAIAGWNWPHDYQALGLGRPIAYTGEQAVFLWTAPE